MLQLWHHWVQSEDAQQNNFEGEFLGFLLREILISRMKCLRSDCLLTILHTLCVSFVLFFVQRGRAHEFSQ